MTELDEENKRISQQVTAMSTQLIESIRTQSGLEAKLNQMTKKVSFLQKESDKYMTLKQDYEMLQRQLNNTKEQLNTYKADLQKEKKLRTEAESMVKQLEGEVEDLTASLFAEANNMVADARKEKHTTEILNRKLLESVKDKDNALETMKAQLKHLKKYVEKMESESASIYNSNNQRYSTVVSDLDSLSLRKTKTENSLQSEFPSSLTVLYSPNVSAIRYDLNLYQEFLKFIACLSTCKSIRDSSNDSKLLRRLNNDEISPILKIDNAPGISIWNRKSLLNSMMDGLVVIEPISGVNETYQIGYYSPTMNRSVNDNSSHLFNYPNDSPPVATHDSCALCGESRDDNVTHARMHTLKVQVRDDSGNLTIQNSYPLCLWCVLRVRQTCDIYAFLRSLKLGTWNLETVTIKDNSVVETTAPINSNKTKGSSANSGNIKKKREELRIKRMSFIGGLGINTSSSRGVPHVESNMKSQTDISGKPSTNIERAWLQLCKLRAMLHWAHIGVWSISDSISTKIGPINMEESSTNEEGDDININFGRIDKHCDTSVSQGMNDKSVQSDTTRLSGYNEVVSGAPSSLDVNSKIDEKSMNTEGNIVASEKINYDKELEPNSNSSEELALKVVSGNMGSNQEVQAIDVGDRTKESIDIIGEYDENDETKNESAVLNNGTNDDDDDDESSADQYTDTRDDI